MKSDEEIMEILEAYDLTGSYRKAAELAGCDHHTMRRYVQLRGQGADPTERAVRSKLIDDFLPKVEELVERSMRRSESRSGTWSPPQSTCEPSTPTSPNSRRPAKTSWPR